MFKQGKKLKFRYPVRDDVRKRETKYKQHRVKVSSVRDLMNEPLPAGDFLRDPYRHLSRWLVNGFALGASPEFRAPGVLRLVTWCPDEQRITDIVCREFQPTVSDRDLMVRLLNRWEEIPHGDAELRVASCDLRIVG